MLALDCALPFRCTLLHVPVPTLLRAAAAHDALTSSGCRMPAPMRTQPAARVRDSAKWCNTWMSNGTAVFSAVVFLGETFTAINALGLCILILGVVLFNWTKYKRLKAHTDDDSEADKAHPVPSSRARYALVDGSQVTTRVGTLAGSFDVRMHVRGRCKAHPAPPAAPATPPSMAARGASDSGYVSVCLWGGGADPSVYAAAATGATHSGMKPAMRLLLRRDCCKAGVAAVETLVEILVLVTLAELRGCGGRWAGCAAVDARQRQAVHGAVDAGHAGRPELGCRSLC